MIAYSRRHHYPNALPDGQAEATAYRISTHADDLAGLIDALGMLQEVSPMPREQLKAILLQLKTGV